MCWEDEKTLKKIINKTTYNTDTSIKLGALNVGEYGDPTGYEERLFETKKGEYFLYGNGGAESKYTEETIALLSEKEVKEWLKENKKSLVKS